MKTRYLSVVVALLGLFLPHISGSQNLSDLKRISDVALKTKNWLEGYDRSTGGNDFNYHSFRNDLSECMITRCSTGEMAVEWDTRVVPESFKGDGVGFVWVAALDITPVSHSFDVFINGTKRFQIISGEKNQWELLNEEGGKLGFLGISNDQHGDAHGYMTLWAPGEWIVPGKPVNIKIVGNAEGSSAWIIIYKAEDALAYLQNSAKYNTWAKITAEKDKNRWLFTFNLPSGYAGKTVKLKVPGKEYTIAVSQLGEIGHASLSLAGKSLDRSPLSLSDELDDMLSVKSLSVEG
jgi:hypothetical protein